MSRSFKKYPHFSEGRKHLKFAKRQANKKVRRTKNIISNGKAYKKIYEQWDIRDFIFIDYSNPKIIDQDSIWVPRYQGLAK